MIVPSSHAFLRARDTTEGPPFVPHTDPPRFRAHPAKEARMTPSADLQGSPRTVPAAASAARTAALVRVRVDGSVDGAQVRQALEAVAHGDAGLGVDASASGRDRVHLAVEDFRDAPADERE